MRSPLIAGVELGGTKALAVLAEGRDIVERVRFPTTLPEQTLSAIRLRLEDWDAQHSLGGVGIASFGPIRVDPYAFDYGHMLGTPKMGWSGTNIGGALTSSLGCAWRIETDVNAAAMAEWKWGAAQGLANVCYITIGTGVGGGLLLNGQAVHGALHPELGHLNLRRASGDTFAGICPFHGDCIEGLVCGPALRARFGRSAEDIPSDDERWSYVGHDLGELISAIILAVSPQKILIGGGVGVGRPFLLKLVREHVVRKLGSYLEDISSTSAETLILQPALGDDAGPLGSIALAMLASDGH